MKILITGSSGMLGRALCKELAGAYKVIGFDVGVLKISSNIDQTDFILVDITDKEFLIGSVMKHKPDIIIHCAAYTDVVGLKEIEVLYKQMDVAGDNVHKVACVPKSDFAHLLI